MDKKNPAVRKYLAERAELLGAVRLPNSAFLKNAGTEVTADIIFLQKRDRVIDVGLDRRSAGILDGEDSVTQDQVSNNDTDWVHLGETEDGIPVNSYFAENPYMILGKMSIDSGTRMYGAENAATCVPTEGADLGEQLRDALSHIQGKITEVELDDLTEDSKIRESIPAEPSVKNFSYALVTPAVYADNVTGEFHANKIGEGNLYFRENSRMFLVDMPAATMERIKGMVQLRDCTMKLIEVQENGSPDSVVAEHQAQLNALYDSFTKKHGLINSTTNNRAFRADNSYHLLSALEILDENGSNQDWGSLSAALSVNIEALTQAQPKDLEAAEISVRLGSTWVDKEYIQQFMNELLQTSPLLQKSIQVSFSERTGEWGISGKTRPYMSDVLAYSTYGTKRRNAYQIMEDTLNLKDARVFDTKYEDGKEKRVLNKDETTIAMQRQDLIKEKFKEWIFQDPDRRHNLVAKFNKLFNSTRPRRYDGSHIRFAGASPEIKLKPHQTAAIGRILYGGNTLLAHEVGAGKTFEMVGAAMELKRLGLCNKSMLVVPNHLTLDMAGEFLRLYPSANILVATNRDFEAKNRKKFCAKISTGDYDAVILGHSQFEKVPLSKERQARLLKEQIYDITESIREIKRNDGARFTVKQMEKTKKSLEARLAKMTDDSKKDDVVSFE